MTSELHPLEPFLPVGARLLMLGSFPPQRVRWSMDFFYPNLQNDMWRIVGLVFFGDKGYFLTPDAKRFDKERIVRFCEEKGLALYDTAEEIIRLKNNASDNFLQVVREVDLAQLLAAVPTCRAIVTTGQKATDVIVRLTGCAEPPVGGSVEFAYAARMLRVYRVKSIIYDRYEKINSAFALLGVGDRRVRRKKEKSRGVFSDRCRNRAG